MTESQKICSELCLRIVKKFSFRKEKYNNTGIMYK